MLTKAVNGYLGPYMPDYPSLILCHSITLQVGSFIPLLISLGNLMTVTLTYNILEMDTLIFLGLGWRPDFTLTSLGLGFSLSETDTEMLVVDFELGNFRRK